MSDKKASGEPVAWVECSPAWLNAGGDCANAPRLCVGRNGISHLHPAHAEQPAPVAVVPEPSYRLLGDGDIIHDSDETLNDDTATWGKVPMGVFIGMPYNRRVMLPVRRAKP